MKENKRISCIDLFLNDKEREKFITLDMNLQNEIIEYIESLTGGYSREIVLETIQNYHVGFYTTLDFDDSIYHKTYDKKESKSNEYKKETDIEFDNKKSKNFNIKIEVDVLEDYKNICEEFTLNMSARIREFIKMDIKKISEHEGGTMWFKNNK